MIYIYFNDLKTTLFFIEYLLITFSFFSFFFFYFPFFLLCWKPVLNIIYIIIYIYVWNFDIKIFLSFILLERTHNSVLTNTYENTSKMHFFEIYEALTKHARILLSLLCDSLVRGTQDMASCYSSCFLLRPAELKWPPGDDVIISHTPRNAYRLCL